MAANSNLRPLPFDHKRADEIIELVQSAAASRGSAGKLAPAALEWLRVLAGNSPYLCTQIRRQPAYIVDLLESDLSEACAAVIDGLSLKQTGRLGRKGLMRNLRLAKAHMAVIAALGEVSGTWSVTQSMEALSDFADAAVNASVGCLLKEAIENGHIEPAEHRTADVAELVKNSGYVVLALGKLGGRELNYSSDIDLVALYDKQRVKATGKRREQDVLVRLTQELVDLLQRRSADGYVFRVDMRLRPDPGATPVALSMTAAESYYQSIGQNWERAALIKARPIAGDIEVGNIFLERIQPFIWRRNLDFVAIADIHRIKRQTHSHYHHALTGFRGRDIKIGPGGIREIEFFTQIQQLTRGGRDPGLRQRDTLGALRALHDSRRITNRVYREMSEAYLYLRSLEHRLQMIDDEQTHKIPESDQELDQLAAFMGFTDRLQLEHETLHQLGLVQKTYERLRQDFGTADTSEAEPLQGETLEHALADAGFADVKSTVAIIERWRSGRYRALRTGRARNFFEALLRDMLDAFAASAQPDAAIARFDAFLAKLPSGVQLFAMLQANHWLFRLIATIMGIAPRLADDLARKPTLFDSILDPGFFDALPAEELLEATLTSRLDAAKTYEAKLEASRQWLNDLRFEVGVHFLESIATVEETGRELTALADVTLRCLLPVAEEEFACRHGRFPGGELAIVAMGSYGGGDLTHTSDLDLILLYKGERDQQSDGPRPLGPSQYFSRLGRHFVTALSALTGEGRLYEVDMRLRPSGASGPLVVTLQTFEDYQSAQAWTWEHMALTRARLVAASESFGRAIRDSIARTLCRVRDPDELRQAVAHMRRRLAKEYATKNPFSVGHKRGGIVDVEFIVEYYLLRDGCRHRGLFHPQIVTAISHLAEAGIIDSATADKLRDAYILQRALKALLRLCHFEDPVEADLPPGFRSLLVTASNSVDFDDLKQRLDDAQSFVYRTYREIFEAKTD